MNNSLSYFRSAIVHADMSKSNISAWSVGQHIHHCCLAMTNICALLKNSKLPAPHPKFSLAKTLVFFTGIIPRGRGKSPAAALPHDNVNQDELGETLDRVRVLLAEAKTYDAGAWFQHHIFGALTRDQALKFLEIHNRHHRKIIEQILN